MGRNCVRIVLTRLPERNNGSLSEALNLVEPIELFAARQKVGLDHDRVAAVDRLRLVTDELHRCRPRDPGALKVPDGGAAQVMRDEPCNARRLARAFPCAVEILNRFAIPTEESTG
jgi:hypothetical protein